MKKTIHFTLFVLIPSLLVGQSKTITAPGTFNFSTEYSFNQTTEESEIDTDGNLTRIQKHTYNANGKIIKEETDRNADGKIDEIIKYIRDANGNTTSREHSDGNGKLLFIKKYTSDANGKITKEEIDTDGNGSIDEIIKYSYDIKGNMVRQEDDKNADGIPNFISKYTYDVKGNRIKQEHDTDGDGSSNWIVKYTFDINGKITKEEYDSNADGSPNGISRITYDENGNKIKEENDSNADGIPNEIIKFTYDENGNKIREEYDTDGDGVSNQIIKITYDEKGNRIRYENDTDANGIPNRITKITYDANGNSIKEELDNNGDGTIDKTYKYTFFNKVRCSNLSESVAHRIHLEITEPGYYSLGLCESAFQNSMALSSTSFCDTNISLTKSGCTNGNAFFRANLTPGTYFLTIAGKGETDNGNYQLNIEKVNEVGIEDIKNMQLLLYPNPATNSLTIKNATAVKYYDIHTVDGKQVMRVNGTNNELDISELDTGIYFIKAISTFNSGLMNAKFIKTN